MAEDRKLSDFPARTYDKLRYADTDRQGHANNAVFSTFFETGRVAALEATGQPLQDPDFACVLARICIDFRAEIFWPGNVEIGTGVKAIGNSSITFLQALFQNGNCVAEAESILVNIGIATHRPVRIAESLRAALAKLRMD